MTFSYVFKRLELMHGVQAALAVVRRRASHKEPSHDHAVYVPSSIEEHKVGQEDSDEYTACGLHERNGA